MELMRPLLQGHLDVPWRITLDVVLKDLHPSLGQKRTCPAGGVKPGRPRRG